MNKGKYVNNENVTVEALSASMVSLLLKEKKVVIPELGYLEIKVFPDKQTVLFKATENTALFLASEGSVQSNIYNNVSVPLKEGKIVALPEVGIFRPIKNVEGVCRISYTISSSLRKLLNDEKETEAKKPVVSVAPVKVDDKKDALISVVEPVVEEQSVVDKDEREEKVKKEALKKAVDENEAGYKQPTENKEPELKKAIVSVPKQESKVERKVPSYVTNASKVGDLVVPQHEEKENDVMRKRRGVIGVAVAAVALTILLIMCYFLSQDKNKYVDQVYVTGNSKIVSGPMIDESTKSYKSIDLPALAERRYGNRIFWVYIYQANIDKISSPVNIPAGTDLRIPDLWEDYKVDVMDSMEVKRAGILSDIMLKQKIQL